MENLRLSGFGITRGYYCPSFFKLVVNTTHNLGDLNKLPEVPFSTFFHEYLHFLQDITTTYGLANGCIIADRMVFIINTILKNGITNFSIPVDISQEEIFKQNFGLRKIYRGKNPRVSELIIKRIGKEHTNLNLPAPYNRPVEKIVIQYEDKMTNSIKEFDFGGLCITESMAHIAQKTINPLTVSSHRDVPYRVAIKVATHMYPEIGKNELFVFSLCDACLMYYHPAKIFCDVLEMMKNEKFIPANEKEIYDFVFEKIIVEGKTLLELFKSIKEHSINRFSSYLTTSTFTHEKSWIQTVLNEAFDLRFNSPDFLIKILKKRSADTPEFNQVFKKVGTPLMMNMDGLAWFNPPEKLKGNQEISIDRYAALFEILLLFEGQKRNCDLINYCKNAFNEDITDNFCIKSPWERCNQDYLCGYAIFWKTWGLENYKPK